MKKNIFPYILLILITITSFIFISYSASVPLQGATGSPGDEANAATIPSLASGSCLACHDGLGNYGAAVNIITNIPSSGYEFSKTYQITVSQSSRGAINHGFEITAENTAAEKIGAFSITDPINTQKDQGNHFVAHTNTSLQGVTSWSFNWTAPTKDMGAITFYASSVAGNGNGITNSQVVFATNTISAVLGINKAQLLNFSMYPNPSDSKVNLQLPSDTNNAQVQIFDYLGKTLIQKNLTTTNNSLDISNLNTGVYFVRIQSDTKIGTKKLIVN